MAGRIASLLMLFGAVVTVRADILDLERDLVKGFPPDCALVQATAQDVSEQDDSVVGTFAITHVYFGEELLSARSFNVESLRRPVLFSGRPIYPPIVKGEAGVWLLQLKGKGIYANQPVNIFGLEFPARNIYGENVEVAMDFAAAVEEAARIPDKSQRLPLARRLARSVDRPLACYGAALLLHCGLTGEEATKELRAIAHEPRATPAARIEAEAALTKAGPAGWRESQERVQLLLALANERLSRDEQEHLTGRLGSIAPRRKNKAASKWYALHELQPASIVQVLRAASMNESFLPRHRNVIIRRVERFPEGYPENETFAWLLAVLESDTNNTVRDTAARMIVAAIPLTADRKAALAKARESVTDDMTAKLLDEAIAKP